MNLSGNPVDYLFAFLGGILMGFTPCVYPLIPISAGYIGVKAADSKIKGFTLSLTYVTGIAVTYSILGIAASLTGELFGKISSYPVTYMLFGAMIIFFALSMFDLFHIALPNNIVKLPKHKKMDYPSTFILGLASGLIVGPCVTSVLGAILAYIAARKNIFYGMTLLFSFAYGMGMILIITGTFSGILMNLPRPGKWMVYVKRLAAFVILTMGIYFIYQGIRRL